MCLGYQPPPNIPSILILINDALGSRVRIFGCTDYLSDSRKREATERCPRRKREQTEHMMIDDHFWPSMYPGIAVGLLVGLSGGNLLSTILGAAGGLAGSVVLYTIFAWAGLEDSILSLVGLIGGAVLGAYLLMRAGSWLMRNRSSEAK